MNNQTHYHIFKAAAFVTFFIFQTKFTTAEASSTAGLLCISECVTCPVICAPPPPPPPPPPPNYKLIPPSSPLLPPPPYKPKSPKNIVSPPPRTPPPPPPPRFIYTFGGVPPPPKFYYGVFPAPPYGRPENYEYPYPYSLGHSCCYGLYQMMAFVVLHILMFVIVM